MLLAVDTGATKTLVTRFDHRGKPAQEFRFLTPKNPDEYIAELSDAIYENFGGHVYDGMVVAVPGTVKDNIATWCPNLGWENVDIASFLSPVVACPIWLQNDANLAGLAETRALRSIPPLSLYVTVSTGIGTGIIIDGQIDPLLSIGEGGHMLLEHNGKLREWESFASGRAIKATYGKYARDIHDKQTWHEITEKIAQGFLTIIPMLQPEIIIIGGSIGTHFAHYGEILTKLLNDKLPPHIIRPKLRQAAHPEEAVLYGCYYYGTDQLASTS